MANVFDYSTTPDSNQTVAGAAYFQEGQTGESLNDGVRQVMSDVAKLLIDLAGATATTGTSTAYALTTSSTHTALSSGLIVGFTPNNDNTGAATLDVDSLGAKKILMADGVELTANVLVSGARYLCVYDETLDSAAGAWLLINGTANAIAGNGVSAAVVAANGHLTLNSILNLPSHTVAELNAMSPIEGAIARCSDGAAGNACFTMFNGSYWVRLVDLNEPAISTS